jgi:predicted transcriptional regulator
MGRATIKKTPNTAKAKSEITDRGRTLLERIRRRREEIRRRVGVLPNSAELIRQDRER